MHTNSLLPCPHTARAQLEEFAQLAREVHAEQTGAHAQREPKPRSAGNKKKAQGGKKNKQALSDAMIEAAFEIFDEDGSGAIDATELVAALGQLGIQASPEEVERLMDKYDDDGNRTLEVHRGSH